MQSRLAIFEALKLMDIYIYSDFISIAAIVHYFVARLLAAEEMQDEKKTKHFISALENVDLYCLILSILEKCCRLLVDFLNMSFFLNTLGFIV